MKCPVTFADFFRFLQAISNMFLLKLREKYASKFLPQLAILVEFVIPAIFAISSMHFWKQFPLILFCPVFNPGPKCTKENEGKCMDIFSRSPRFVKKTYYSCIFLWACISYKSRIQIELFAQKLEKISVILPLSKVQFSLLFLKTFKYENHRHEKVSDWHTLKKWCS